MNKETGLIMISYTDNIFADYWENKNNIKPIIKKCIKNNHNLMQLMIIHIMFHIFKKLILQSDFFTKLICLSLALNTFLIFVFFIYAIFRLKRKIGEAQKSLDYFKNNNLAKFKPPNTLWLFNY